MNLTGAEAALIAQFANSVRGTSYGLRETEYRREVDRVNGLTLKEEPKPPGNRFSGLDLPNADKS
jgi:hypothetical protein